jgi:hypothetical protein
MRLDVVTPGSLIFTARLIAVTCSLCNLLFQGDHVAWPDNEGCLGVSSDGGRLSRNQTLGQDWSFAYDGLWGSNFFGRVKWLRESVTIASSATFLSHHRIRAVNFLALIHIISEFTINWTSQKLSTDSAASLGVVGIHALVGFAVGAPCSFIAIFTAWWSLLQITASKTAG